MLEEDEKNCQVNMKLMKKTVCSDKQCQDTKLMWPVKPQMDMQSREPATQLQSSFKKKHVSLCKDKKCQSTKSSKYIHDDKKCQSTMCCDKNCQETQCLNM